MEAFIKGCIVEVYQDGELISGLSTKDFNILGATVTTCEEIQTGKYLLEYDSIKMKLSVGKEKETAQRIMKRAGTFKQMAQFLKKCFKRNN